MAVGDYTLTSSKDPQAVCTAFEGETNISACVALGTVGEASTDVIVAGEVLSSPAHVVFRVTGTAAVDITNAATALGYVETASGYPAPA